jgi:hypothetical protein
VCEQHDFAPIAIASKSVKFYDQFLQFKISKTMNKGGAAGTLSVFLREYKDTSYKDLIPELTKLSASLLADSIDTKLHDLLRRNGFNKTNSTYDDTFDIEKLCKGLNNLTVKRSSLMRSSQIGIKTNVKSFAPDLLMSCIFEKKLYLDEKGIQPFSVFFDGIVLIADISGFTKITGSLCECGEDGIDQLQQATTGYLGDDNLLMK